MNTLNRVVVAHLRALVDRADFLGRALDGRPEDGSSSRLFRMWERDALAWAIDQLAVEHGAELSKARDDVAAKSRFGRAR